MEPITWLALGYQVPANPSKNRVYIWRKLKELGAVYFRQGVAILPKSPQSMTRFRTLAGKIRELGGDATLAELRYVDVQDEDATVREFQAQSQKEYREVIREMTRLREEIRTAKGHSQPESAKRVAKRLGQVRSRDYFMSRRIPEIARSLDELLRDMSNATNDLGHHFSQLMDK